MTALAEYLNALREQGSKPPFHIARGHFRHQGDVLYLRYGMSGAAQGRAITIADVTVASAYQGQGRFRLYLEDIERHAAKFELAIVAENIINPILTPVLLRRGFKEAGQGYGSTMVKLYC